MAAVRRNARPFDYDSAVAFLCEHVTRMLPILAPHLPPIDCGYKTHTRAQARKLARETEERLVTVIGRGLPVTCFVRAYEHRRGRKLDYGVHVQLHHRPPEGPGPTYAPYGY